MRKQSGEVLGYWICTKCKSGGSLAANVLRFWKSNAWIIYHVAPQLRHRSFAQSWWVPAAECASFLFFFLQCLFSDFYTRSHGCPMKCLRDRTVWTCTALWRSESFYFSSFCHILVAFYFFFLLARRPEGTDLLPATQLAVEQNKLWTREGIY